MVKAMTSDDVGEKTWMENALLVQEDLLYPGWDYSLHFISAPW